MLNLYLFKKNSGFTLIELLVVISIIGVLSSTVMVAVQDARNKANDKALLAQAIQLRNALELYKEDHGGLYPGEPSNRLYVGQYKRPDGSIFYSLGYPTYNNFISALSPYLQGDFMDPIYTDSSFQYARAENYNGIYYKCTGQNITPRYVILIQPKSSMNLPTLTNTMNGNPTVVTNTRCISSPE